MTAPTARRREIAVLVVCLLVLAATPGLWRTFATSSAPGAGEPSIGSRPVTSNTEVQGRTGEPTASPAPQGSSSGSGIEDSSAVDSSIAVDSSLDALPALLLLPSLGLSAEIDRVGVRPDGQVEIPDDGDRIGWYRFGALPGSPSGSSVLVGHRDTQAAGPGILYRLNEIQVGARIDVVREDWGTLTYEVVARESLGKATLPVDELFREQGPPVLTLITCGGRYTPGIGYEENLVVTAIPRGNGPAV